MAYKMVICARCNKEVSKKSTLATDVQTTKFYNRTSKLSRRKVPLGGKSRERKPSVGIVKVTRMCRKACK